MDIVGADGSSDEVAQMFDEVDYKHEGKIYFPEFVQIMKQNGAAKEDKSDGVPSESSQQNMTASSRRRTSVAGRMSQGPVDAESMAVPKDKHQIRNEIHMKIHDHVNSQAGKSPRVKEEKKE